MIRADLHVHSCFSTQSGTLRFLRSRDCYSTPLAVYQVAKRRGMDVVTLTDHDTIDGCLALLDAHPVHDFFISEEMSCRWPGADIEVHLGVYGITEGLHRELQPLRGNVFAVIDALRASDVFFSLNHLFHFYRHQVPLETYLRLLSLVPAVEARNGTMLREHNELIARLARGWPHAGAPSVQPRVALLGGSDAHTLRRVGQTWTQSPGTTATDFLRGLREGLAEPGGNHGTAATVAGDTYGVVARFAASLLGYGPRDHRGWARAARLGFVAVSAPAQFLPVLIALRSKRHERLVITGAIDTLTRRTPAPATATSPLPGTR